MLLAIPDLWELPLNEVVSGFLLWLWGRCGLLANTRSGSNACWVQLGERRNDVVVDVGFWKSKIVLHEY